MSTVTRAQHLGPARRREPVLDAALATFAEGGFAASSMTAIAAKAEVSKAVLYDCFPGGKEELWHTLLDREEAKFVAHLGAIVADPMSMKPEEALAAGFEAFLGYAEINPSAFGVIFGDAGSASPELRRRVERVREHVIERMRDLTVAQLDLPPVVAPGAELFVRVVVAVAEELARWTLKQSSLPRPVVTQLAANWLTHGIMGTVEAVARHTGRQPGAS